MLKAFLKDESGFIPALISGVASWLGSAGAAKAVGGGIVGGIVDRWNAKRDYKQQRKLGFTHSEIAGAGGAGAGDAMTSVMGNQATAFESQKRQMAYDHAQRQLDREVAMRGQDAGIEQARLGANASIYSSNTQRDIQTMHNDREWQKMANEWANNNPELNLRFKQMSMGFENVRLELVLARNGLGLNNLGNMSQADFNRRMTSVMSELAALEGFTGLKNEGLREGVAAVNDPLNPPNPILGQKNNYGTPGMPQVP